MNLKLNIISRLCLLLLLLAGGSCRAEAADVDVKGLVFGHLNDAYEWHITTVGHKHITIPLPGDTL